MNKSLAKPFSVIALALVLVVALVAVSMSPVAPAAASSADNYALYTWTNNGITATANGASRFIADYGQFECYQTIDATLAQTVTLSFESSANGSNWAAVPAWQFSSNVLAVDTDFAGVSTDGTTFGLVVLYGEYIRPVFTLGGSNPITDTLRCIAKDKTYSIDDDNHS